MNYNEKYKHFHNKGFKFLCIICSNKGLEERATYEAMDDLADHMIDNHTTIISPLQELFTNDEHSNRTDTKK